MKDHITSCLTVSNQSTPLKSAQQTTSIQQFLKQVNSPDAMEIHSISESEQPKGEPL